MASFQMNHSKALKWIPDNYVVDDHRFFTEKARVIPYLLTTKEIIQCDYIEGQLCSLVSFILWSFI
ncbi:hypothetical protein HMPREF0322_03583 [Desulfitobacterium hafniense DP7]|uniref:Uncharacterized protein n=1 Tax=Desulfitobacterium hafniense DP7 TaxID=537010 RepID=G9XRI5_DESHA|nr:hypothetical protein HMPREF0322_03583 [Desulfitobacterium hafniense DP7]